MSTPRPTDPILLPAARTAPPLPADYGCLYLILPFQFPMLVSATLTVSGQRLTALAPGRWFVPTISGRHSVRVGGLFGIPIAKTEVTVQPGHVYHLGVEVGWGKFRFRDLRGRDVTTFGLWSHYVMFLVALPIFICVCGPLSILAWFFLVLT